MTTSIRAKLALLAGVPVIGALLLALFVVRDANLRAASAASLGSIEDLARLTATMTDVLHAVQDERAVLALATGPVGAVGPELAQRVASAGRETDATATRLDGFLAKRDRAKLPPRLTRGLADATRALESLAPLRARLGHGTIDLQEIETHYGGASAGLLGATAALAELSDDGTLLRNIAALGALLDLEERSSLEHAIVGHAAARGEFPPGAFKALVTTTTEEELYDHAFRTSASDDVRKPFEDARARGRDARQLLDSVLKSTEDTVSLDASTWDRVQGAAVRDLRDVEHLLLGRIESAAASKGGELRRTIRLSFGVSIAVLLLSIAMAFVVGRGVQGAVTALTDAAGRVRSSQDFSVRARRVSHDELGMLTDTFNEMLSGIQARDAELEQHRSHLEGLVVARTKELAARNAAMRLVLDNVDQGLATIGVHGGIESERSAAFDRWFGATSDARPFEKALAPDDERLRLLLRLGWEQVTDGFLPPEVTVEQLPKRFDVGDRHFTLTVKPILEGESVAGALLVVTDVTAELEVRKEHERQREEIQVFRRMAKDRGAFLAFVEETGSQVERLRDGNLRAHEQLALVHTVKGNAAQYDVTSVAEVAHRLESTLAETRVPLGREPLESLLGAWDAFVRRAATPEGKDGVIHLSRAELERILGDVRKGVAHGTLAARLQRLFDEPIETRFARLGEHAERLATRLGKPVPTIAIDVDDLRLPKGRYASLWSALVHVVRNAVDHGIEDAPSRAAAGKPSSGKLTFRARLEDANVVMEIGDDGAGVDWERLATKARAAGMPATRREEIERAMFASGISSTDAVTDISGRGVGLAAVWESAVALGGAVRVESERGAGTKFVFRLPG
jgi:two-component system chemotaxis sensor kinase CheA